MYTNKELEDIYNKRYSEKESQVNNREVVIYNKYRNLLIPTRFRESGQVSNLDLGCGRGHKTIGFSRGFKRVLAIDISSNVISHCNELYNDSSIEFKAIDATEIKEKFNLISAFGFSLFNTPDNDKFLSNLDLFIVNNLEMDEESFFIIGSFTDFSGKGKDSWYLHTKKDLDYISKKIEAKYQAKVKLIFPHKRISNYFGSGIVNFAAEVVKLIKKKKRTFFIVIEHG